MKICCFKLFIYHLKDYKRGCGPISYRMNINESKVAFAADKKSIGYDLTLILTLLSQNNNFS